MADDDDLVEQLTQSLDFAWLFLCLVLVLVMQAGFAAYEVGTIRTTTSSSILKKNLGDASISLVAWILLGYAIANGKDAGHAAGGSFFLFTGQPFEATEDSDDSGSLLLECVFRWSFAATCTTIVSGAVADRIYVKAYFVYAFCTSALFYPLLAHAVWADEGWASPLQTSNGQPDVFIKCGVVDFAGSGVVHMLGGGISLVLAVMVKNRPRRFIDANKDLLAESKTEARDSTFFERIQSQPQDDDIENRTSVPQLNEYEFRPSDPSWMTLGCLLLWIGWYGFNAGGGLQISTEAKRNTAGRTVMNTTIGAGIGCFSSMIMERIYHLRSPTYRRGKRIDDPLKFAEDEEQKFQGEDENNKYEKEHKIGFKWFFNPQFKWSMSTHKDIHIAACNGILAGLVGITAGCATMDPGPAIGVSFVSALWYHFCYRCIICWRTDDAVNAAAVHLCCGIWGLVAAGFTVVDSAREDLGYPGEGEGCTREYQFLANLVMAAIIFVYSLVCGGILWAFFKLFQISDKTREDKEVPRTVDRHLDNVEKRLDREVREVTRLSQEIEELKDSGMRLSQEIENLKDSGIKASRGSSRRPRTGR